VAGFRNILIFYLPRDDGIHVVRVLHMAQDWFANLDVE
jgi:plasmid stabilization system protein ParE